MWQPTWSTWPGTACPVSKPDRPCRPAPTSNSPGPSPERRTLTGVMGTTTLARWASHRRMAFDVLLAAALTLVLGFASVAQLHLGGLFGVAQLVPLVWRRSHPTLVFATCSAVAVLQWLAGV